MKKDLHPKTYKNCVVTCACGNTFTTTSTLPSISVEICSACHPFYTGQRRFVDTERRIDKFTRKQKLAEEKKLHTEKLKKARAEKKKGSKSEVGQRKEQTVREMLDKIKEEEKSSK